MTNPTRRPALPACLVLVALLACASDAPPVESLKVGSRISRASLLDQNDEPHQIDESVRIILFAREMEGGAVIRALLEKEGPSYLANNRALYVADISEMPAWVARTMAIPKMKRERPYPTLLDRDGTLTAAFPAEDGRVTVLGLDKLRVTAIHFRGSIAGVQDAVKRSR